jgi:hypothetical protein
MDPRAARAVPHWEPGFPDYSWLSEAAAQARAESKRYWAANDGRFPVQGKGGWYAKKTDKRD